MRKSALALALVLAMLISSIAEVTLVNVAKANFMAYLPEIVIKSDGSITPETDLIKQTGNVYSLTANLSQEYAITIKCSNIVFDGAGHVINGSTKGEDAKYISGYGNTGLRVEGVTNVTVRDMEIVGFDIFDVSIVNCSACVVLRVNANSFSLNNSRSNVIGESNIAGVYQRLQPAILMSFSNNNKLYRNSITNLILDESNNNMFFQNNFVSTIFSIDGNNLWDNGSVGNYWSDYLTRYPNALEIGNTGIGDTSYVMDVNNVDHYPLMAPVDNVAPSIEVLSPENKPYDTGSVPLNFTVNEAVSQITYSLDEENIPISGNTTLTGLANGDHTLAVYAWDEAGNVGTSETISFTVDVPFPTALVMGASGVSIAGVAVCLLYYHKKRKL